MDGRFTGWTRPHGGVRGPDAPAVQSGQMVKSHQTLAMALGPWGHGYNAEQASVAIMHGSCMLSAFCTCSTLPCMWNTPLGTPQMAGTEAAIRFCVLCCMFQAKNRSFFGSR